MSQEQRKTIQINPEFLKLPSKGNKTRKNNKEAKPIKIRSKEPDNKSIKRRALNLIRKMQEDKYRRLTSGKDEESTRVEMVDPRKTYADTFQDDFQDSLAFLQKLTDQTQQKISTNTGTLKQYPVVPNSTLLNNNSVLNQVLSENDLSVVEPEVFRQTGDAVLSSRQMVLPPQPAYGCLKGGKYPTYRAYTQKTLGGAGVPLGVPMTQYGSPPPREAATNSVYSSPSLSSLSPAPSPLNQTAGSSKGLSPEQQRAELKQFLNKKSEEKKRIEQIKRQRNIINPRKHQRKKTTRTFRVGKSKFYPRVGVLIPNKTIRTQILNKKQKLRETPLEDIRKHLIKKGLIRVGSSCPNDVLRQMYESSMMMCGELQNHNPDNLLFNYLNNAL
jgi:hypothetical protein